MRKYIYTCDRCGGEAEEYGNVARFDQDKKWVSLSRRTFLHIGRSKLPYDRVYNRGQLVEPDLCLACEESLSDWWTLGGVECIGPEAQKAIDRVRKVLDRLEA